MKCTTGVIFTNKRTIYAWIYGRNLAVNRQLYYFLYLAYMRMYIICTHIRTYVLTYTHLYIFMWTNIGCAWVKGYSTTGSQLGVLVRTLLRFIFIYLHIISLKWIALELCWSENQTRIFSKHPNMNANVLFSVWALLFCLLFGEANFLHLLDLNHFECMHTCSTHISMCTCVCIDGFSLLLYRLLSCPIVLTFVSWSVPDNLFSFLCRNRQDCDVYRVCLQQITGISAVSTSSRANPRFSSHSTLFAFTCTLRR